MSFWLPESITRHDRSILPPRVAVFDGSGPSVGAACYFRPARLELECEGRFFDMRRGLICVSHVSDASYDAKDHDNAIAHEWRHHWQTYNRPPHPPAEFDTEIPYRQAIINFFLASAPEMDALLFAQRIAPSDTTSLWLEWLLQNQALQRAERLGRRKPQLLGRSPHLCDSGTEFGVSDRLEEDE